MHSDFVLLHVRVCVLVGARGTQGVDASQTERTVRRDKEMLRE